MPPNSSAKMVANMAGNGRKFINANVVIPAIMAAMKARSVVLPTLSRPGKWRFKMVRRTNAWVVKVSAADNGIATSPIMGERIDERITKDITWMNAATNGVRVF